ncbi:expressed unknown protein [Seminavis robusta]|uniref:L domain-like protein n=1 Tax=Seminavis robusta TaxID=568900 RepID=A0A9N8EQT9_9STRA|nr:expressed unknown protein [Seminavis robusta]|eukprot:Sro1813_g299291.1  (858) ;mRNA; r:11537-14110
MEIVAGQASLAVAERLNAKVNEAAEVEGKANRVPSDAQNATRVPEEQDQDSGPGNMTDTHTAAVEPVPEPGLYRTNLVNPQSQPGAFLGAPGGRLQRNPNLNYGLLGAHNSGTDSGPGDLRVGTAGQISTNEGLVQANAVEDDTAELMHANPVDLEAAQHRTLQKKQQQRNFLAAVLWLLLVVAIIVGFVVGTQKNKEPKVVVLESTEAPTVHGSMQPSEVPSIAPTGSLDLLLDRLPEYTLASINSGSETPQWKAWWWLANHQNITFLPEWRKTQLFALATFFYAFQGENWNPLIKDFGWMDDTVEECDWFSSGFGYFALGKYNQAPYPILSCNDRGEYTSLHLEHLRLHGAGLSPFIPPEITLLTALAKIRLQVTDISMSISSLLPTKLLHEMTGLTTLNLSGNEFTGKIPSEISLMSSLSGLFLGLNQLSGQIPSEIGLLTSLARLSLPENELTGQLPSELGLLRSLETLFLSTGTNQFTGELPSELGLLTLLKTVFLTASLMTGPIPSELGLLTSLEGLLFSDNQFTGPIPFELGKLTSLTSLSLNQHQLTGQIPSELGLLTSLDFLWLAENRLLGPIPSELGMLTALTWLECDQNQLTGQVPSELGLMVSLLWIDLSESRFTGPLPSELGLLTSLSRLSLFDNQFTGTIPTEIGMMTALTSLALHNNSLAGTLPSQLNASIELRLYGNQFSGTVPDHLCSLLGCNCSLNETPPVSTCAGLTEAPVEWPGLFPTSGADVMLNIQTDEYPEETSWIWQKETNVTGIWDTLESGGPLGIGYYLYSSLFLVNSGTAYRLIVSDIFGDGIPSGWITVTATNQTVLYSLVGAEDFSEITVDVLVGADGSFDAINSTAL